MQKLIIAIFLVFKRYDSMLNKDTLSDSHAIFPKDRTPDALVRDISNLRSNFFTKVYFRFADDKAMSEV